MSDKTGIKPGGTWRERAGHIVLDPNDPNGDPLATPVDRRWLWRIDNALAVLATNDDLRQLGLDLRAYLAETCDHHMWCAETKPVGEFARSPKGWVTDECRACETERLECWARVDACPVVRGRRYVDEAASCLICTRCGRDRPKSLFYTYSSGKSGRRYYRPKCKQCCHAGLNRYNAERRRSEEGKKRDRDRWLWKRYRITLAEYEFLLFCQDGRCGLCGTSEAGGPTPESSFHVDHDHVTKRVRGLLCRACNTAIGLLKEDPELFMKAVTYLRNGGVFEDMDDDADFNLSMATQRLVNPATVGWPGCERWTAPELTGAV